jgi:hypothetical protein
MQCPHPPIVVPGGDETMGLEPTTPACKATTRPRKTPDQRPLAGTTRRLDSPLVTAQPCSTPWLRAHDARSDSGRRRAAPQLIGARGSSVTRTIHAVSFSYDLEIHEADSPCLLRNHGTAPTPWSAGPCRQNAPSRLPVGYRSTPLVTRLRAHDARIGSRRGVGLTADRGSRCSCEAHIAPVRSHGPRYTGEGISPERHHVRRTHNSNSRVALRL